MKKSTIKISFSRFVKDKTFGEDIKKVVDLTNKIVTEGYHLCYLHILRLLEDGEPIPTIDQFYMKRFLYTISEVTNKRGRPQKVDEDIEETYRQLYEPLRRGKRPLIRSEIDSILMESATDMATCINNNIKIHFFKRQRRYIKSVHPELDSKELSVLLKTMNEDKNENDYHPKIEGGSIAYDLEMHPERFLSTMYRMNAKREDDGDKLFSILSIRKGFISKNIRITHTALEHIVRKDGKAKIYFETREESRLPATVKEDGKKSKRKRDKELDEAQRDILWETYFNIHRVISKTCPYRFVHHITTDGISVSVLREHKEEKESRKKKEKKKKEKEIDFDNLKGRTIVGIDPGKHSILYMTIDDDKKTKNGTLDYTNTQRAFELGTKKFRKKQRKRKDEEGEIQILEDTLSQCNSRTSRIYKFQEYLKARFAIEDKMYIFYSNEIYRIHRWWGFQRKQKSEDALIKRIQRKFGSDCVLAYGSWNRSSQMKGLIPSPTSGIRRKLSRHFTVIDVSEYNTTKTCCKCEEKTMGSFLKREDKKGRLVDVRGIRRCQNEECGVIMNRDYNASINIRKNLICYIKNGHWCEKFKCIEGFDKLLVVL